MGLHSGRSSRSRESGGMKSLKGACFGCGFGLASGSCAGCVCGAGLAFFPLASGPLRRYAFSSSAMAAATTTTPTTTTAPSTISGAARTQSPTPRAAAPKEATAHFPVESLNCIRSCSRAWKHRSTNTGQGSEASCTTQRPSSVQGSSAARWRLASRARPAASSVGRGWVMAQAENSSRSAAQLRASMGVLSFNGGEASGPGHSITASAKAPRVAPGHTMSADVG